MSAMISTIVGFGLVVAAAGIADAGITAATAWRCAIGSSLIGHIMILILEDLLVLVVLYYSIILTSKVGSKKL